LRTVVVREIDGFPVGARPVIGVGARLDAGGVGERPVMGSPVGVRPVGFPVGARPPGFVGARSIVGLLVDARPKPGLPVGAFVPSRGVCRLCVPDAIAGVDPVFVPAAIDGGSDARPAGGGAVGPPRLARIAAGVALPSSNSRRIVAGDVGVRPTAGAGSIDAVREIDGPNALEESRLAVRAGAGGVVGRFNAGCFCVIVAVPASGIAGASCA
jgi:hypothetical protein